ncbi:MAG: hypothetical protein MHMPM18_003611, partial [Marteilia pararefringens]
MDQELLSSGGNAALNYQPPTQQFFSYANIGDERDENTSLSRSIKAKSNSLTDGKNRNWVDFPTLTEENSGSVLQDFQVNHPHHVSTSKSGNKMWDQNSESKDSPKDLGCHNQTAFCLENVVNSTSGASPGRHVAFDHRSRHDTETRKLRNHLRSTETDHLMVGNCHPFYYRDDLSNSTSESSGSNPRVESIGPGSLKSRMTWPGQNEPTMTRGYGLRKCKSSKCNDASAFHQNPSRSQVNMAVEGQNLGKNLEKQMQSASFQGGDACDPYYPSFYQYPTLLQQHLLVERYLNETSPSHTSSTNKSLVCCKQQPCSTEANVYKPYYQCEARGMSPTQPIPPAPYYDSKYEHQNDTVGVECNKNDIKSNETMRSISENRVLLSAEEAVHNLASLTNKGSPQCQKESGELYYENQLGSEQYDEPLYKQSICKPPSFNEPIQYPTQPNFNIVYTNNDIASNYADNFIQRSSPPPEYYFSNLEEHRQQLVSPSSLEMDSILPRPLPQSIDYTNQYEQIQKNAVRNINNNNNSMLPRSPSMSVMRSDESGGMHYECVNKSKMSAGRYSMTNIFRPNAHSGYTKNINFRQNSHIPPPNESEARFYSSDSNCDMDFEKTSHERSGKRTRNRSAKRDSTLNPGFIRFREGECLSVDVKMILQGLFRQRMETGKPYLEQC